MTDTINPCPCCGGECRSWQHPDGEYYVECYELRGCGYSGPMQPTTEKAIAAHNDLTSRAKLRAWVEGRLSDAGHDRGRVYALEGVLRYLDRGSDV